MPDRANGWITKQRCTRPEIHKHQFRSKTSSVKVAWSPTARQSWWMDHQRELSRQVLITQECCNSRSLGWTSTRPKIHRHGGDQNQAYSGFKKMLFEEINLFPNCNKWFCCNHYQLKAVSNDSLPVVYLVFTKTNDIAERGRRGMSSTLIWCQVLNF